MQTILVYSPPRARIYTYINHAPQFPVIRVKFRRVKRVVKSNDSPCDDAHPSARLSHQALLYLYSSPPRDICIIVWIARRVHLQRFSDDDGICALCARFVMGIIWYATLVGLSIWARNGCGAREVWFDAVARAVVEKKSERCDDDVLYMGVRGVFIYWAIQVCVSLLVPETRCRLYIGICRNS